MTTQLLQKTLPGRSGLARAEVPCEQTYCNGSVTTENEKSSLLKIANSRLRSEQRRLGAAQRWRQQRKVVLEL